MARRLFDEKKEYRLRQCSYKQPFGWKCGGGNRKQGGGLLSLDRLYCRVYCLAYAKLGGGDDESFGASAFALLFLRACRAYAYARDGGVNADMHMSIHVIENRVETSS